METADFDYLRVSTEAEGRVVVLELDHGKANEIGEAVLGELDRLRERLVVDERAVALITYSRRKSRKGTPIFIAGADVTERRDWTDVMAYDHAARWNVLCGSARVGQASCQTTGEAVRSGA